MNPNEPLPFFVYGTLRPGEHNHDRCLLGRTSTEEPARLASAVLYDGPGYPYVVEGGTGTVLGELVTAPGDLHQELTAVLDDLEEYFGPDDPRNVYVRVARDVETDARESVTAWVYVAAEAVARELRARGTVIPGGDWTARGAATRPARPSSPTGSVRPQAPAAPRTP
ncbi:gamma-glutamylcyclotransferase family protein [Streptomyces sp. SCSIO 30461]|uniref:gamma-glutamylcyclotransferase family protein n=1 Tax=Streptomyces sp. SCSIO 30461 TaxID=3118085 RepID=UPI0030D4A903